MSTKTPRYGTIDREYGMRLATTDSADDAPVWMVNLMKYRDVADYTDGRESTISGQEADDLYSPHDSLAAVGATPVFFADVDQQLRGDDPLWDRIGVVKYPTRRAFIDMQSLPSFQEAHEHKEAGMEATIVMGTQPMFHGPALDGFALVDWADVPHPPTDEDGPVILMQVLRFADTNAAPETPEQVLRYEDETAKIGGRHGLRVRGWFAVEGTIIGDGRAWHQVRFVEFPSKAAVMAAVADPVQLAANREHREPALADSYTMILRAHLSEL